MRKRQNGAQWRQHAGFSLFFDYVLDNEGKQSWQTNVWQTRIYHDETDKEMQFSGIEPQPWVNWILEQADLANGVAWALGGHRSDSSTAPVLSNPNHLSILNVLVELESLPNVRNKTLMASVQFIVSGVNAEMFTAESTPYQLLVLTVDQHRGLTTLVAAGQGFFQPEQTPYTHHLDFPIPDLGRYELQTIVLIQSQIELMAVYHGPTITVIP